MPRFQFGVFDFDSETGGLRREGIAVKLQAQPAQVLSVLLASPGQLVTRDALRQAVWGSDTFVDFDRGLNFCIVQIRSALRDSADSPRYIRTLPRKGYQFIAPVTVLPDTSVTADASPAIPPSPMEPLVSPGSHRLRRWALLALGAVLMLATMTAVVIRNARSESSATKTVAVFRLDNNTGDPQHDRLAEILTDSIIGELTEAGLKGGRSGYFVIGNDAQLRQSRSQRDLLTIGRRLQTPVTISGSIRPNPTPTAEGSSQLEVFIQLITLPDQRHRKVIRIPLAADALTSPPTDVPRSIAGVLDPVIRAVHMSR